MAPRNQKQKVVNVETSTEGLTEGHKAVTGHRHIGVPSVGAPTSLMDVSEYAFRQHNNGGKFALLRPFQQHVAACGYETAQLPRACWDRLYEQFGRYDGTSDNPLPSGEDIKLLAQTPCEEGGSDCDHSDEHGGGDGDGEGE